MKHSVNKLRHLGYSTHIKASSINKISRLGNIKLKTKISLSISLVLLLIVLVLFSYVLAKPSSTTNITINTKDVGATFDGIGAISGGGGNSRLLIDYPKNQRNQILDYLFKPNYGASLQLLKIEIGGDGGTTDGSEASIENSKGQINCHSGYEWQLAKQAIALNPKIKIYGLQWTAPGWINAKANNIWTKNDVNYVINWMNCARTNGLTINYLGGWDEEEYNANWYIELRNALNQNGYTKTQIVAADNVTTPWKIATSLTQNKMLAKSVSVIGVHDTCLDNPNNGYSCAATTTAKALGIPLWESELGGMPANSGAASMVRAIVNGYTQANITGYLEWPLIDAIPPGLPFENRGLITADQPWSGHYNINLMTWAIAQTTQFTQPGWLYLKNSTKSIGNSGSYISYVSRNRSAWTMVAENTGSYVGQKVKPQTIHVKIINSAENTLHVWQTDLWAYHNSSKWFQKEKNIRLLNGQFSYVIQPGMVVTFTTMTGQNKQVNNIPSARKLDLPYTNSLTTNDGSDEPSLLSPQDGSFQLVQCLGAVGGLCTQQTTPQKPILWGNGFSSTSYPYAILGDNWSNYTLSVNILFQHANSTGGIIGRFSKRSGDIGNFAGYMLNVSQNGEWSILKNYDSNRPSKPTVLASGKLKAFGLDQWITISLTLEGFKISALINGQVIGSAIDSSYTSGLVGIESSAFSNTWSNDQYNDLSVVPATLITPSPTKTVSISSAISTNECLNDYDNKIGLVDSPNKVTISNCNGSTAQSWLLASGGSIQIHGQCLGTYQLGKSTSNKVVLAACTGNPNQIWLIKNNSLINKKSNQCLADPNYSRINYTQLQVNECSNAKDQKWLES